MLCEVKVMQFSTFMYYAIFIYAMIENLINNCNTIQQLYLVIFSKWIIIGVIRSRCNRWVFDSLF